MTGILAASFPTGHVEVLRFMHTTHLPIRRNHSVAEFSGLWLWNYPRPSVLLLWSQWLGGDVGDCGVRVGSPRLKR